MGGGEWEGVSGRGEWERGEWERGSTCESEHTSVCYDTIQECECESECATVQKWE